MRPPVSSGASRPASDFAVGGLARFSTVDWPGQIVAVPGETKEGDSADMKAIAGQATELPKKAVE